MASQSSTPADAAAPSPAAAATREAATSPASSTPAQNPAAAATAAAGATDLEKKMRRAERFGTAVVMSEEEKRSSRAER
jgi:SAP domain-containing ribonucleoprotein